MPRGLGHFFSWKVSVNPTGVEVGTREESVVGVESPDRLPENFPPDARHEPGQNRVSNPDETDLCSFNMIFD